jgi:hypothetical protein
LAKSPQADNDDRGLARGIRRFALPARDTYRQNLGAAVADGFEDGGYDFGFGFGALVAFAVEADADVAGFEVARADDEHGVDFGFLGALDFAVDFVGAKIAFGADLLGAEFGYD